VLKNLKEMKKFKNTQFAVIYPDGEIRDVFSSYSKAAEYRNMVSDEYLIIVSYTLKVRYQDFLTRIDNLQGDYYLERHLFGIVKLPIKITKKRRLKFLTFILTKEIY
jgi:hypothetical protein